MRRWELVVSPRFTLLDDILNILDRAFEFLRQLADSLCLFPDDGFDDSSLFLEQRFDSFLFLDRLRGNKSGNFVVFRLDWGRNDRLILYGSFVINLRLRFNDWNRIFSSCF